MQKAIIIAVSILALIAAIARYRASVVEGEDSMIKSDAAGALSDHSGSVTVDGRARKTLTALTPSSPEKVIKEQLRLLQVANFYSVIGEFVPAKEQLRRIGTPINEDIRKRLLERSRMISDLEAERIEEYGAVSP